MQGFYALGSYFKRIRTPFSYWGEHFNEDGKCTCVRDETSYFYFAPGAPKSLRPDKECSNCDGYGAMPIPWVELKK